jgi:hypothetical protein
MRKVTIWNILDSFLCLRKKQLPVLILYNAFPNYCVV